MKRELACIVCPSSCVLDVDIKDGSIKVSGNICEKGVEFVTTELSDPVRVLTTTVKISSGGLLPVRSKTTVKKSEMKTLVSQLKDIIITPPVTIGQIIVDNFGKNAVDIVASENVC